MSLIAKCPQCEKNFRVPHANKVWSCKTCGNDLVVQAKSTCPECKADVDPGADSCDWCGYAFTGPRVKVRKAQANTNEREMRRTRQRMSKLNLPVLLWVSLGFGLLFLLLDLAFLAMDSGEVLPFVLLIAAGLDVIHCIANAVGIAFVRRFPFPVLLSLALFRTLALPQALLFFTMAPIGWLGVIFAGLVVLHTLGLWVVVAPAFRLQKLAKENPDLYQSRLMRGAVVRQGIDEDRSVARRGEAKARKRARGGALRLFATAVAAGALVVGGYYANKAASGPSSPNGTLAEFQTAWNAQDVPGVAAHFGPDKAEKWTRSLLKMQRRYEWEDALPVFERFEITGQGTTSLRVAFHGPNTTLVTKFAWKEDAWRATSLDMRGIKDWRP